MVGMVLESLVQHACENEEIKGNLDGNYPVESISSQPNVAKGYSDGPKQKKVELPESLKISVFQAIQDLNALKRSGNPTFPLKLKPTGWVPHHAERYPVLSTVVFHVCRTLQHTFQLGISVCQG